MVAVAETTFRSKPFRSGSYLNKVRGESCLRCDSPPPSQAHHLRHAEPRGVSRKTSDLWAVPLCWACHGSCHTRGNESEWWAMEGIDPIDWAIKFQEENLRVKKENE